MRTPPRATLGEITCGLSQPAMQSSKRHFFVGNREKSRLAPLAILQSKRISYGPDTANGVAVPRCVVGINIVNRGTFYGNRNAGLAPP